MNTQLYIYPIYKIDWTNYLDWNGFSSSNVISEENYEGLSSVFWMGWAYSTVSKNLLKRNTKYRVKLKAIRRYSNCTGSLKVSVGDNSITETITDGVEYEWILDSGDSDLFKLRNGDVDDVFGITELTIEQISPEEVSLNENINIALNYNVADIKNPAKRSGTYSKTFTVPGDHNNNKIFNYIFEINSENKFNVNSKTRASILSNSSELANGFIKLNEIIKKNDEILYDIVFYGDVPSLFIDFGDKKLSDLDWSEYNHTADLETVTNLYSSRGFCYPYIDYGEGWGGFVGEIGTITDEDDIYKPGTLLERPMSNIGLTVSDLYPAMTFKAVWDNIMTSFGYEYTGMFTSSTYHAIILPFTGKEERLYDWRSVAKYQNTTGRIYTKEYVPLAGSNSLRDDYKYWWFGSGGGHPSIGGTYADGCVSFAESGIQAKDFTKVTDYFNRFNNSLEPSIDVYEDPIEWIVEGPNSLTNVIPGTYTVRKAGEHKIKCRHKIIKLHGTPISGYYSTLRLVAFRLRKTNIEPLLSEAYASVSHDGFIKHSVEEEVKDFFIMTEPSLHVGSHGFENYEHIFNCEEGDMIGWKLIQEGGRDASEIQAQYSWIEVEELGWGRNAEVLGNNFIPEDYTIRDFVNDALLMFNLYIDVDKENPRKLLIESRKNFYSNYGTTQNWSDLVDYDSDIISKHPQELQKKEVKLKYADADDYWNGYYNDKKDVNDVGYGGKRRIFENDFIKGEQKIELSIKPSVMRKSWRTKANDGHTTAIYTEINPTNYDGNDNNGKENNVKNTEIGNRMLFFYPTKFYNNDNPTFKFRLEGETEDYKIGSDYYYPFAGHQAKVFDQTQASDLNFETAFYDYGNQVWQGMFPLTPSYTSTNNNLYNQFWKGYFDEISDKDARLVRMKLRLTDNIIAQTTMSDTIQVGDTYYIINKIRDYIPGGEYLTEVELLKKTDIAVDFVTGSTSIDSSIGISIPTDPFIGVMIGRDNIAKEGSHGVLIGDKNTVINSSGNTTPSLVVGNNSTSKDGGIVLGGKGSSATNKSVIIGGEGVKIEGLSNDVVVINEKSKTISSADSGSTFISGVKIKNGNITAASQVNNPGIDCVQTLFSNACINNPGENQIYLPDYIDSDTVNKPE